MNTRSLLDTSRALETQARALLALAFEIQEKAPPEPTASKAHTRWTVDDDWFLAGHFGPALRARQGDFEEAITDLALILERTPVAVALRLARQGVLDLR